MKSITLLCDQLQPSMLWTYVSTMYTQEIKNSLTQSSVIEVTLHGYPYLCHH